MFNRTMEAQAREILISALSTEIRSGNDLVRAIRQDICKLNLKGIELEITPREHGRKPPFFNEFFYDSLRCQCYIRNNKTSS